MVSTQIRREPPPEHLIVVDTSILWCNDKEHPVSPEFNDFWSSNRDLIPMYLILPEVVLGELHFQQTTSAGKIIKKVDQELDRLTAICCKNYTNKHSKDKAKHQIYSKLDRWLKSVGGLIAPTPVSSINWNELIEKSIWRIKPFSFDPDNTDNEKGFRDALIMETFLKISNDNLNDNKNIIFICKDYLLKEAVEDKTKTNTNVLVFETLQDFGAYIQLTQEEITNKFVKSIQTRAQKKFFSQNKKDSCIFYKQNITQQVEERFPEKLTFDETVPSASASSGMLSLASLVTQHNTWINTKTTWWINATRFTSLEGEREYHWATDLTVAQKYTKNLPSPPTLLTSVIESTTKIKLIKFNVKWKANVRSNGKFYDIDVSPVQYIESSTEIPNEEMLNRWQLL